MNERPTARIHWVDIPALVLFIALAIAVVGVALNGIVIRPVTILIAAAFACLATDARIPDDADVSDAPFVYVLGVAQDAGYPQAACRRAS